MRAVVAAVTICLIAISIMVLQTGHASAAPVAFPAVADALVTAAKPDKNFGSSMRLKAKDGLRRSYLRFVVSPPGPIREATLLIYAESSSPGFEARSIGENWREGKITFNTAPVVPAAEAESSESTSPGDWSEVVVTDLVASDGRVNLVLTTTDTAVILASSESTFGPQLLIEPGPAPSPTPSPTEIPTPSPTPTATPSPLPSPSPTPDPVIAAAGDIACDPNDKAFNDGAGTATECRQMATSDLLVDSGLTAVLTLGDNQYDAGGLSAFQASYAPSWGRVLAKTFPAPGNHDYVTADAAGYFDYFGVRAGDPSLGYYSFDIGAWHLVALNSNCSETGGCGAGSPEEQWLRADLAAHPAACTLAYWHHPRFSSGLHGTDAMTQGLWQALYDLGADVVLTGHDHDYERFAPLDGAGAPDPGHGIREFVVGTGGASHYDFETIRSGSEVRNDSTFGVLKLTLHPSGYDWAFVPIAGSFFTDSGSGTCH